MSQPTKDLSQVNETRESDRNLERLGDFEETRYQPVPREVRQDVQQTLDHSFQDSKPS